jgi:chromosomal replication initiation ATPase DnaA
MIQDTQNIIEKVAKVTGISYLEIVGSEIHRCILPARVLAMHWVVKSIPDANLTDIGSLFRRDPNTVKAALQKHRMHLREDKCYQGWNEGMQCWFETKPVEAGL